MEQEVFVKVNLVALSREASQGSGQTLQAFAVLLGCESEVQQKDFANLTQAKFSEIFATENSSSILENLTKAIRQDSKLANQCARV
jgi:hypothetical protein